MWIFGVLRKHNKYHPRTLIVSEKSWYFEKKKKSKEAATMGEIILIRCSLMSCQMTSQDLGLLPSSLPTGTELSLSSRA